MQPFGDLISETSATLGGAIRKTFWCDRIIGNWKQKGARDLDDGKTRTLARYLLTERTICECASVRRRTEVGPRFFHELGPG